MEDEIPEAFHFWIYQSLSDALGEDSEITEAWRKVTQKSINVEIARTLLRSIPEMKRDQILFDAKLRYRNHNEPVEAYIKRFSNAPPRKGPGKITPSTPQSLSQRYKLSAGLVLNDCRFANELIHEEMLLGPQWRIRWLGAVSAFRAAWHVLKDVDAKDSLHASEVRNAIENWNQALWAQKAMPHASRSREVNIFYWLTDERNQYLKEYRSSVTQEFNIEHATCGTFRAGQPLTRVWDVAYRILDEPFKDEDPRRIYAEAIEWFDKQLSLILHEAHNNNLKK